jgi:lysophospholipase L1-like esterase
VLIGVVAAAVPLGDAGASGGAKRHPTRTLSGYSVARVPPRTAPLGSLYRRKPYITGSPRIVNVSVGLIRHGRSANRVRVDVRVSYPGLSRAWRGLISGRATYRGVVRVSVARRQPGRSALTAGSVTGWLALPVTPGRGRAVRTLSLLLPRAKARGLRPGVQITARLDVRARFEPWGRRSTAKTVGVTPTRRLRVGSASGGLGATEAQGGPCTGPADLGESGTDHVFAGHVDVHADQPLKIRLCTTAATQIDPAAWTYSTPPDHGTASPPALENGYYTITYQPNPGFLDEDFLQLSNNRDGDRFIVVPDVQPFTMAAMGDSITAGFGYLGNGDPAQFNGNANSFDAVALKLCVPLDNLNDRCSSNTDTGRGAGDLPRQRWRNDSGLSNNVAWPAQFANWHGIGAGGTRYINHAVTGSSPEDWSPGGSLKYFLEHGMLDTDLVVLTLGANPILGTFLQDSEFGKRCGVVGHRTNLAEQVRRATACLDTEMKKVQLYDRLRAIYRRLLDDPFNHVVVALYPVAWPPMPYYVATGAFVNEYAPPVLDRLTSVINGEIRRAVTDEAAAARARGQGDRLFVFSPPRFNLGVPGYAQSFEGDGGQTCGDLKGVDGPSSQSEATQTAALAPKSCRGNPLLESLDGVHLSRAGHTQFANALESLIEERKLPVPERPGALANELNAKCLDVTNGKTDDQTPLQMYPCNNTPAQQFTFTGGELHVLGKCVDGTSGNQASAVTLVTCHHGVNQKWHLDDQRRIVGVNGLCIDIVGQNQDTGARLHLWTCHGGPSQKWVGPGPL